MTSTSFGMHLPTFCTQIPYKKCISRRLSANNSEFGEFRIGSTTHKIGISVNLLSCHLEAKQDMPTKLAMLAILVGL